MANVGMRRSQGGLKGDAALHRFTGTLGIERTVGGKHDWPEYRRGSLLVFAFFLGFIVFWYLQGSYRFPALGAIRFEFLMGAFLAMFAIPAHFANPYRHRSGVGIWAVLLFLVMLIMVGLSYVPGVSLDIFIDRVVKFALIGFFVIAFVTTPGRLRWFIGAFLFACLKMGQEGFVGTLTGSLIWENQGVPRLNGPTPNYGHPNSFAGMALGCLPFILYFYKIAPRYLRVVLLVQLAFMVNIIVFTGSRTAYVALAVGLWFLIRRSEKQRRAFFLVLIAGLVVGSFIPHDYIERARTIITQQDMEGRSIDTRKEILEDAWQVFLDNPLGVGVHAFPAVRQDRFGREQDTHNLYLEVATNLGVQGLIVFIGLIAALLRTLSRLAVSVKQQIALVEQAMTGSSDGASLGRMREHLRDLRTMWAACAAVYVFLMIRLGLGLFGMDLYEIYWWFALGTTVAVWNMNAVAQRRTHLLCGSSAVAEGASGRAGVRIGKIVRSA